MFITGGKGAGLDGAVFSVPAAGHVEFSKTGFEMRSLACDPLFGGGKIGACPGLPIGTGGAALVGCVSLVIG